MSSEYVPVDYDEYAVVDGWGSLLSEFERANIDARPLAPLSSGLVKFDDWKWGTENFPRTAHYLFRPALEELLTTAPTGPSLMVSHGGHGSNSYGVTVRVVTDSALVLTQSGWGGIYMDAANAARAVSSMFASVAAFVEQAQHSPPDVGRRHVLVLSDFRSQRMAGTLDVHGPSAVDVDAWLRSNRCEGPAWMRRSFFDSRR